MQTVILDLSRKNIIPPVHAKQGDVGRKFKAVLTDAGMTYAIPRGAQFSVWYSGASGEGNYSAIGDTSAFTVTENAVIVELITQMLTNAGTCSACLVMHGADGSQLGLWNIVVVVELVPGMDSEAAEQHYTALSEVAENAVKAAETFQTDTTLKVSGRAADAAAVGTALEGKAPAGYGLGTHATAVSDFNEATATGWYSGSTGTANKPFGYSLVHVINRNGTEVLQIGYDMAATTSGAYAAWTSQIRRRSNNTWSEWEYVNPPMYLGVEYRTTERWNGKAVYTKLVNFGTMPNATTSHVAHGISGISQVIRTVGQMIDTQESFPSRAGVNYTEIFAGAQNIYIYSSFDASSHSAYAQLWYVKG